MRSSKAYDSTKGLLRKRKYQIRLKVNNRGICNIGVSFRPSSQVLYVNKSDEGIIIHDMVRFKRHLCFCKVSGIRSYRVVVSQEAQRPDLIFVFCCSSSPNGTVLQSQESLTSCSHIFHPYVFLFPIESFLSFPCTRSLL